MANISKLKIGNTVYEIKDTVARDDLLTLLGSHALEALKDAAWLGVDSELTDEGEGLVKGKTIKAYIDSVVPSETDFDVIVVDTLPEPSADTYKKIYLQEASTPAQPNLYMEWLTLRSGTAPNYTYTWEKIGDTSMDLSLYVQKTTTIAGVDLQDNITKEELQTALDLGAFAYVDEGEVSIPSQTVTGLKATGKVLPEASASASVISANVSLVASDLPITGTVTGVNESSTVTFTDNTNTNVLTSINTAAVAPTFTEGEFTPASLTKTNVTVATEGVTAVVGTGTDNETLIINNAATATASNVTAFTGGSKAADVFNPGSAATFNSDVAIKTLGTGTAAAQTFTGSFTGDAVTNGLVTGATYDKINSITLDFSEVDVTLDVDDVVVQAQSNIKVNPK